MNNKQKPVSGYAASLLSGAAIPLGFSPFNLWSVLMLAIAAVFITHRNTPPRRALLNGFLFGVGMFGAGTSWIYVSIHQFGAASPALAGLLTGLFVAGISLLFVVPCFWLYSTLRQRWHIHFAWQQALLFSALWLIFEWTRSWLLTGFPWLLSGYSLLDTPAASWAPVTGVYGLSFLVVITSTLVASLAIKDRQAIETTKDTKNMKKGLSFLGNLRALRGSKALLAFSVAALWIASWPLATIQWTKPTGEEITFSAIQGNIPQGLKWNPDYIQNTVATYINQTRTDWQQDLIIWPENALPLFHSRIGWLLEQLNQKAENNNSTLITGLPIDIPSSDRLEYYNGIVSVGQGSGTYYKQKLVPFGEYVPFESLLRGLIAFFDLPMSSFSAGNADQAPLKARDIIITPYICYEVVYPDFAARMAHNSGLLLTISNDTWFGQSIGPEQHFQMARMRAIETGRYLIRGTNDGITALVNDHGKTLKTIPRFEEGVLRGSAKVMSGNTPFMIAGSWPVLILCLAMIAIYYVTFRKKQ